MNIMDRMRESIVRRLPTEAEHGDKFIISRDHLINIMSLVWVDGIDACLDMQREQRAILEATPPEGQPG